jgi:hypothetical protein
MKVRLLLCAGLVLGVLYAAGSASALPNRLNQAQWSAYLKSYNAYVAQTPKTVARFRFCRRGTKYSRDLSLFGQCLGTAATREIAVTNTLFNTLHGFSGKTGGQCAKALSAYAGALFFWKSSVVGVDRAVKFKTASVATVQGQAGSAVLAAQRVATDATAFAKACKPLG